MGLLLLGPGGFNLGGPFIGLFSHAEKLFSKAVRESRQGTRYGLCFFAAYGKVNDSVVNRIISNKSAGVSQLRQFWRQVERFDFLREIASLSFRSIHHAFNTNSEHCARRSWGQIDDALRLFENLFGIFGHAINGGNSASCGKNKFAFLKQSNSFAPTTHRNVILARTKKPKGLIGRCFPKISSLERVLINERCRTGS